MAKKGLILVTSCSSEQLNGLKSFKKITRRQAWGWEVAKNWLVLVGSCSSRLYPPLTSLSWFDWKRTLSCSSEQLTGLIESSKRSLANNGLVLVTSSSSRPPPPFNSLRTSSKQFNRLEIKKKFSLGETWGEMAGSWLRAAPAGPLLPSILCASLLFAAYSVFNQRNSFQEVSKLNCWNLLRKNWWKYIKTTTLFLQKKKFRNLLVYPYHIPFFVIRNSATILFPRQPTEQQMA